MATYDDGHISFVGQAVAGKPAASPESLVLETRIGPGVDSVCDEEEFIPIKESDFKRKQVRLLSEEVLMTATDAASRNSRDGCSCG